jgi:UDP-2-acetamido-3-amino-2,3-dideoxy-glucuronate N-acetyltransferase
MSQNVRPGVAVVGCGYWGRNLVRNFSELGNLVAVCDVDAASLEEMQKTYRVKTTPDFEDLLQMPEVLGVVIAAPAAQHYELTKRALLAGKDVFVEKPLALRLEDGEKLVQLARQLSRVLMVGHLLLYHPAITKLRNILQAGELGKIEYISSSRLNLGKVRTEEDILWSFAPHDISAILHLLEESPIRVTAQGASYLNHSISDVTLTILNFASGVKAHIFVSWLHPFKEQRLVVVGDRKMAVFDDAQGERKLLLYPHRVDWVNRMPVTRKAEGEAVSLEKSEPLRLECEHFIECIVSRKQPRTDGENGLRVLRILHAAGQSIRESGQPIPLEKKSAPLFFAHSSAFVDEPCEIGSGTKIWHFSHVMQNCRIGHGCSLGQNVNVASGVVIGDNVKIQNNVSLYSGVELERDVFCGPSMVFTNVITPRSHVNRKSEYQRTLVKRGATLGANSTIVCGVTVGRYAFVGAGAVVTRDVPDHALMVGVPARQVGWVCDCGVRLNGSDESLRCRVCGETYVLQDGTISKCGPVPPPRISIPANDDVPSGPEEPHTYAAAGGD